MSEPRDDVTMQKTPAGYTIPLPSIAAVESALQRVAEPAEPRPSRGERSSSG